VLINDERAATLVTTTGYDFGRISRFPMSGENMATMILRNQEFDCHARDFVARQPEAAVVYIGCVLDSRFERVGNCQVEWYDLDLPDIIELCQKSIGDEGERYHLLGCSVLDNTWLDAVSAHRQRPSLFLAEGVFMHLEEAQAKWLVVTLHDRFPGAELVFDAFSPLHVWTNTLLLIYHQARRPPALGDLAWPEDR
jgi:O-methyltransferase involved in polyketide biosynthesis